VTTFIKATGQAIRAVRRAKEPKLTQAGLAEELKKHGKGWTQKKVSLIEAGRQAPNVEELEQIARALECDLKELLLDAVERMR
jgi:transcriptional regulator with XRE-family HTH domain